MRLVAILFALLAAFSGSALADPSNDVAGEGSKRVYRAAHATVFDAALSAAKSRRLEVAESNRQTGLIRLSSSGTVSNWGERVTVLIRPLGGEFTQVEVVNKPVFEFIAFSPYWDQILLAQIEVELRPRDDD
jgi:hypothetical protein